MEMKPTEEQVDAFLRELRTRVLAAREVTIDVEVGAQATNNYQTGLVEFARTDAYTLTLQLNGGAKRQPARNYPLGDLEAPGNGRGVHILAPGAVGIW